MYTMVVFVLYYLSMNNDKDIKLFAAQLDPDIPACDLHGLYPHEALSRVELFLYDQQSIGVHSAKIIYGGGTGILREKVLQHLHKHPLVDTISEQGGYCIVLLILSHI